MFSTPLLLGVVSFLLRIYSLHILFIHSLHIVAVYYFSIEFSTGRLWSLQSVPVEINHAVINITVE